MFYAGAGVHPMSLLFKGHDFSRTDISVAGPERWAKLDYAGGMFFAMVRRGQGR